MYEKVKYAIDENASTYFEEALKERKVEYPDRNYEGIELISSGVVLAPPTHHTKSKIREIEKLAIKLYKEANNLFYKIKISYSWGDEEPERDEWKFDTKDDAWKKMKELAINEAEIAGSENDSEIGLKFNKEAGKIDLHYFYDDEWCYYKIVGGEQKS